MCVVAVRLVLTKYRSACCGDAFARLPLALSPNESLVLAVEMAAGQQNGRGGAKQGSGKKRKRGSNSDQSIVFSNRDVYLNS